MTLDLSKPYGRLAVHPFADEFPLLEGEELSRLVDSVRKNGIQVPLLVDHSRSVLIDGRNRLAAAAAAGIDPAAIPFTVMASDATDEQVLDAIISGNLERRHLTPGQLTSLAAASLPFYERAAKERQRDHSGTAPGRSAETLQAETPGVSAGDAGHPLLGSDGPGHLKRLVQDPWLRTTANQQKGRCPMRAYKFALDPSGTQLDQLNSHVGGATKAFNWAVGRVKDALAKDEKISWSHISLRNEWNAVKDDVCVNTETGEIWWPQNSKWVYDSAIADAAQALANWKSSKTGARKGKVVGFVRFKTKRNRNRSFRVLAGVRLDGHRHVTLPRIGAVRTHENTKKLARKIQQGGVIKSTTVSCNATGRWFVSILVDCPDRIRKDNNRGGIVGIDLGLKTLAVVADVDGNVLHIEPNNKHLKAAQTHLRRAQRVASRRQGGRNGQPRSNRGKLADAKVARIHQRVSSLRTDQIHKFTNAMAHRFPIVVVEDLNVAGMVKNRKMAKAVSDAAFGEIRRQLQYKVETVFVADRWYASSKTCSSCGAVKDKLHLGERTYECESCGLVIDRDVNAAKNLARVALNGNAVGYTVSGRGLSIGPHLVRQPRTKRLATIPSQPAPADRLVGSK